MDVNEAIGMVLSGMIHKEFVQIHNIRERSIRRSYSRPNSGNTLETRSGRPPKFLAKIMIAKSLPKRRQSTMKFPTRITKMGYQITRTTVRRYLPTSLCANSYKRAKRPKLTKRRKEHRLKLARERQEWIVDDFNGLCGQMSAPLSYSPQSITKTIVSGHIFGKMSNVRLRGVQS